MVQRTPEQQEQLEILKKNVADIVRNSPQPGFKTVKISKSRFTELFELAEAARVTVYRAHNVTSFKIFWGRFYAEVLKSYKTRSTKIQVGETLTIEDWIFFQEEEAPDPNEYDLNDLH